MSETNVYQETLIAFMTCIYKDCETSDIEVCNRWTKTTFSKDGAGEMLPILTGAMYDMLPERPGTIEQRSITMLAQYAHDGKWYSWNWLKSSADSEWTYASRDEDQQL